MKLLELYKDRIMGAISGLDRIRFRGTLRWLASESGIRTFLGYHGILLKDYSQWAGKVTQQIRDSCLNQASRRGLEIRYLNNSKQNKEQLARQIAESQGIHQGPICLFSVVEPCIAPTVQGDRASKQLIVKMRPRKCIWIYYYFNDSRFGFGHVRLQSWLPLSVFVCLNGKHWLECQLQAAGIDYRKDGNCFPWIEDIEKAQALAHQQLQTHWPTQLSRLTLELCPDLPRVLPIQPEYYWSADETEWATDILFRSSQELERLYPSWIHHAIKTSDSFSVMRFLGRRHRAGVCPKDVVSDYRRRYEGVRVKHWKNLNSVKLYNKCGNVLRIETTINNTRDFKVFRRPDDDPQKNPSWQKMRKGVSDLHRRCQISDQCNTRYGDALAAAQIEKTLQSVISPACSKVRKNGRTYRGLNPFQPQDYLLLKFLTRGELAIHGFRNKDLRQLLYPESAPSNPRLRTRLAGRTTRRIRLLRVHGLIRKIKRENRYVLTPKGRQFSTALMTASTTDIKVLTEIAA